MTDVLVAYASRHGSTEEIAHAIGAELSSRGLSVDVRPVDEVGSLGTYSAYVLGSAVYMGSWLPTAREFLDSHRGALAARPTWLFSSGPVNEPVVNGSAAFDATQLVAAVQARDHHLFGGRLDSRTLGLRERLIARLVRARDGDQRDWAIVTAWAIAIGRALDGRPS